VGPPDYRQRAVFASPLSAFSFVNCNWRQEENYPTVRRHGLVDLTSRRVLRIRQRFRHEPLSSLRGNGDVLPAASGTRRQLAESDCTLACGGLLRIWLIRRLAGATTGQSATSARRSVRDATLRGDSFTNDGIHTADPNPNPKLNPTLPNLNHVHVS